MLTLRKRFQARKKLYLGPFEFFENRLRTMFGKNHTAIMQKTKRLILK